MHILPLSKEPQPDEAEFNAFFPSPFSLSQFTSPKSNMEGADYPQPYRGTRRILVICTAERYLKTEKGTLFSTGNHPVETLVPMYHLHKAGFEFDIATVSGNAVKFEFWAMPKEDEAITHFHGALLEQFQKPLKLSDVVSSLGPNSGYVAVFIPGGHGLSPAYRLARTSRQRSAGPSIPIGISSQSVTAPLPSWLAPRKTFPSRATR